MKNGFEALGRVRVQALLLLAIAFGTGIVGGMALERVRAVRSWRGTAERMRPDFGPPGAGRLGFFDLLDVTDQQREQIRAILEASRSAMDSVFRSSMPHLLTIHDSVRAEIRAVLTPEQQTRFDEMEPRWGGRPPAEWGGPGRPGERGGRGPGRFRGTEPPPADSR